MQRRSLLNAALPTLIAPGLAFIPTPSNAQAEALIIAEAGSAAYWLGVVEAAIPYIQAFSGLYSVLTTFGENPQEARLKRIELELKALSAQISKLEEVLKNLILDTVAKQLAAEVLGYRDSLDSYTSLKTQGILDNVLTQSAITKNRLAQYIDDGATPHSFKFYFGSLLNACTSLRMAAIGLYPATRESREKLVLPEAKTFLARIPKITESAQFISDRRVKQDSRVEMFDELGPIYGTVMSVTLDGKPYWNSFVVPRKGDGNRLSQMRTRADAERKRAVEQAYSQSVAPLLQNANAVQAMLADIGTRNPLAWKPVPSSIKARLQ